MALVDGMRVGRDEGLLRPRGGLVTENAPPHFEFFQSVAHNLRVGLNKQIFVQRDEVIAQTRRAGLGDGVQLFPRFRDQGLTRLLIRECRDRGSHQEDKNNDKEREAAGNPHFL